MWRVLRRQHLFTKVGQLGHALCSECASRQRPASFAQDLAGLHHRGRRGSPRCLTPLLDRFQSFKLYKRDVDDGVA